MLEKVELKPICRAVLETFQARIIFLFSLDILSRHCSGVYLARGYADIALGVRVILSDKQCHRRPVGARRVALAAAAAAAGRDRRQ